MLFGMFLRVLKRVFGHVCRQSDFDGWICG